jgi:acetone carboxylase, gamma subunit
MSDLLKIAENLLLDLARERWLCEQCGHDLGDARDDVKRGLLVGERDPSEVHPPLIEGEYTFAPNPEWVRILEFYCPGCGVQLETEYLPPGHPITHTTQIDLDSLKARLASGSLSIEDGHLKVVVP